MATVYLSLSAKADINNQKEILIRFTHGSVNQRAKTSIFVPNEYWDEESKQIIIPNFRLMNEANKQIKDYLTSQSGRLNALTSTIQSLFNNAGKEKIKSDWLKLTVDKFNFPDKYKPKPEDKQSFFELFDEFLQKRKLSDVREKNFMVLRRALQRFEMYVTESKKNESKKNEKEKKPDFKLDIDTITSETIKAFEDFLSNEHTLYDKYRGIYDEFPDTTYTKRRVLKPQPRGMNTINALFNKLRAFFNWCLDTNKTTNRPFRNYESTPDSYGTPYYITIDERNQIFKADLSDRPKLAIQRDIFVFQCLIGCRVGDLYKMTKDSVIGGAIEYIPHKTKDGHPVTVRVPLNDTAKEILKRYESYTGALLPFISEQKYNEAIKDVFRLSGITRIVTVLNPTTREEEKRPINEIASSHLARRTFVGNLYKKVKDPNLVGSLSGHKEGSKAFARYRDIDEDMKTELIKMLE